MTTNRMQTKILARGGGKSAAAEDAQEVAAVPLPCPFCGHAGLSFSEGSTFRWLVAACKGCGASAGETRVQTLGEGARAEWQAQAQRDAIAEWNKRAPVAVATSDAERAALISAAKKILGRLCEKGLLSMSIPVRPTDEDMILCEVIDLASRSPLPIDFKQATDQGGWISVNERLPESGLTFLAHCQCGGESSGIYTMRLPILLDKNTRPEGAFNRERVTHWQSLPAAPTLLGVADGDAVGGKSGGASND